MQAKQLTRLVLDALDERKGEDILVLDVRELTDITDYMIVASGRSRRQVAALADEVILRSKRAGRPPIGVEGLERGEWVLIDLLDTVVHVMQPETRDFYQLEKLWGGKEAALAPSPKSRAGPA